MYVLEFSVKGLRDKRLEQNNIFGKETGHQNLTAPYCFRIFLIGRLELGNSSSAFYGDQRETALTSETEQ